MPIFGHFGPPRKIRGKSVFSFNRAPLMKRKNGGITGGTGDVNPQYFIVTNDQTAANAYREAVFPTPIPRVPRGNGDVTIMEVLKIFWEFPDVTALPVAGGSHVKMQQQISTRPQTAIVPANPGVLSYKELNFFGAFTAAGSMLCVWEEPCVTDLTDGAGHGILVATDNMYFGVDTNGFGVAATLWSAKIEYRMKNVSLVEYIGIVQSQQG